MTRSPFTIHADTLARHVHELAGAIGERNVFHPGTLEAAAAYIEGVWRREGFEVGRQSYRVRRTECSNLEITCTGRSPAAGSLLVGAHYDSVLGSPGANDNASGVAALLDLARLARDWESERSLRFVAFVNEEPPFFNWGKMGSEVYARAARRRGDDIRLMVSLETLGCYDETRGSQRYPPFLRWFYPDRGNFVGFVSNLGSRRWLRRMVAAFRQHSDLPVESAALPPWIPGIGWSDHRSFWRQGYSALMITDTAFYRYPHYHAPTDTPDKVDYETLARLVSGLALAFHVLVSESGCRV